MKTEIGKMDSKDWMVIGGIGLVSLTGIILVLRQIKKLNDRKKLLSQQLEQQSQTKSTTANTEESFATVDGVRAGRIKRAFDLKGDNLDCIGCDGGNKNCWSCDKQLSTIEKHIDGSDF